MKTKDWILPVLSVAIAITLWLLFQKQDAFQKESREYWEDKGFTTDTLKVQYQYILPAPSKKEVPPLKVIQYTDPPAKEYHYKTIVLNDSLLKVIDSLEKEIIVINERYLKIFPKAHKLIHGKFSGDSLRLDVLDIEGHLSTIIYGVNYDRFTYQWRDNELKADPLRGNTRINSSLYGYGGYDVTLSSFVLGGDYSVYRNNWRLKANIFGTIEKTPQASVQVNLGYRIR
jgi:hypothetical protein